jgi:hypothetical protein
MKKSLIALALLLFSLAAQAQLSVGGAARGSKISEKELKEIQATTTIFIVQEALPGRSLPSRSSATMS